MIDAMCCGELTACKFLLMAYIDTTEVVERTLFVMTEKQKLAERKRKGQITREKILESAIEQFSKNGYDKTSIEMLAKDCGVTHVAILYHFQNKLGLFRSVVDYVVGRCQTIVNENVDKNDDAYGRLIKYFESYLTWTIVYRSEAQVLLLLSYFATVDNSLGEIYKTVMQSVRDSLENLLLAGKREGLLEYEGSSALLARTLHDSLFGMVMNVVAGHLAPVPPKQLKDTIRTAVQSLTRFSGRKRA